MALASKRPPTSRSGKARSRYALPLILTDPASGASRPMIIRIVVDLPDPFGPRNPVTWPGLTSNERSSTATVSWYRFVTPLTSITVSSPAFRVGTGRLHSPAVVSCVHADSWDVQIHRACGSFRGRSQDGGRPPPQPGRLHRKREVAMPRRRD